jgi:hypothetical protein
MHNDECIYVPDDDEFDSDHDSEEDLLGKDHDDDSLPLDSFPTLQVRRSTGNSPPTFADFRPQSSTLPTYAALCVVSSYLEILFVLTTMVSSRSARKHLRLGMVQPSSLLVERHVPPNCKLSAVYPVQISPALQAHQIVPSRLQGLREIFLEREIGFQIPQPLRNMQFCVQVPGHLSRLRLTVTPLTLILIRVLTR